MIEEPLVSSKKQSVSSEFFTEQFIAKLKQLEGECQIKEVMYLRINYPKAICLTTLMVLSIVGLLLLKYFIKLRAKVFYSSVSHQQVDVITHIYVKGQEGEEEISEVIKTTYNNSERITFQFKKLKYEVYEDKCLPIGFPYIGMIGTLRHEAFSKEGLSSIYVSKREQFYGKNEHRVQVPGYFQFLFDTMTAPFFVFQYLVSLIYILQSVAVFGVLMIIFGFITTSINYLLLKRSYNKIKETAENLFKVKVLRNGVYEQIDNIDIVPGDLYEPAEEIPCDSIVVKGEMFVDEVNLTGQNVPIPKFKINDDSKHSDKSHWLFEGSKVETMKQHTLAVAINVGYASQRGRIIRKILNKTSKQPQFFRKLIYFQLEVMLISFILYFATLPQLLSLNIDTIMVVFRFFDFITYSFPAPFPIFFNLAYSFCLVRLNNENIIGTQAEKTVQSSRMKTICFDKTGTLTMNKMEVSNIYAFAQGETTEITTKMQDHFVNALFATCNSVELINGEVKGDEIDLRMFQFVRARLLPSESADVVRQVAVHETTVEVIKINQYESEFQSMSVLVRDPQSAKYFVFVKGSPEMIHHYSLKKVHGFDNLIKKFSFSGFRSIGFGYKELKVSEVEKYMKLGREDFLMNTNIIGVVTFVNKLKTDAQSTIRTLAECDINTKIITGDNIFLGVQTAITVGMIPPQAKITVIEGKKYRKATNTAELLHLFKTEADNLEEQSEIVQNFTFQTDSNHFYAVDNHFIKENPQNFLHDRVKVFARISPQNKALIVRLHKQKIGEERANLTFFEGLKKECSYKVGMVGDGANDLIAIKEADVGIGISTSDAVFSASFAVRDLQQILQIIKESKNSERQIVEMTKYYGLTQFISIVVTLICSTDASYFTSLQLIYKNFLSTLVITLFFGVTRPANQMTKYLNNSNLLDLEHHLVYWVSLGLFSVGLIVSYVYYANTPDFIPNKQHRDVEFGTGWYGKTQSSTVNFITSNIVYILLPFAIFRSAPWKLPITTNFPVMALILLNMALLIPISVFGDDFSFLGVQAIPFGRMVVIWAIMIVASLLVIGANKLIEKIFFQKMKREVEGERISHEERELVAQ